MTFANFWNFHLHPPCHCDAHTTYQYYGHVWPTLPPLCVDVICDWSLSPFSEEDPEWKPELSSPELAPSAQSAPPRFRRSRRLFFLLFS